MQFSSRLSIAVHTLLVIEYFKDQYKITSDFIASSVGVNPVIIRNTFVKLKAADLVEISGGRSGTINLKRSPEEITMLDIFRAVESDQELFHLNDHANPNCPVGKQVNKILEKNLVEVKRNFENDLNKITLKNFLDNLK